MNFPIRLLLGLLFPCVAPFAHAAERPNILWITTEDMSLNLGCYGDTFAHTPNIDALAQQSVRYTHAFATAPVCAPARACLITGVYATAFGNPHLRCEMTIPADFKGYGAYLRAAGYFTSNNVKTDYNLRDETAFIDETWNSCDGKAHWRQRQPDQPFMAVFNNMETHQSRTGVWPEEQFEREIGSRLSPSERADPNQTPVPPFYPQTASARQAMARYYDCIAAMDQRVGQLLHDLETDGLAGDTIVFFYSDHGMGLPRGKRLLHDSGMHVPLLVRFPEKWQHLAPAAPGATTDRLVSFVDFAPTVLSLAGVAIPPHMQGVPFLGSAAGPERDFVFGARDRVDEVIDTARSVRDARWLYIRNYRPHLSWAPPEGYSDMSPFRRELLETASKGKAGSGSTAWLAPVRPLEELYDTVADPHQLRNLAADPAQRATLEVLRERLRTWLVDTRDLAFLPEADMLARSGDHPPNRLVGAPGEYPFERVLAAAELVGQPGAGEKQRALLPDDDPAVRYWAAAGMRANAAAAKAACAELEFALDDKSGAVRIEAAGALLAIEEHPGAIEALRAEIASNDGNHALHALRTLELLGVRAKPLLADVRRQLPTALEREGKDTLALFHRFSIEGILRNFGSGE